MSLEIVTRTMLIKKGMSFVTNGVLKGALCSGVIAFLVGPFAIDLASSIVQSLDIESLESFRNFLEVAQTLSTPNKSMLGAGLSFCTLAPLSMIGGGVKGIFNYKRYRNQQEKEPIMISYRKYLTEGKTEEEAKYLAIKDQCTETIYQSDIGDEKEKNRIKKALDLVVKSILYFQPQEDKTRIIQDIHEFSSLGDVDKEAGIPLIDPLIENNIDHLIMREKFIRKKTRYQRFLMHYATLGNQ